MGNLELSNKCLEKNNITQIFNFITGADNKRKFHLNLQNRKNEDNGNAVTKNVKTRTMGGGGEKSKKLIFF